MFRDRFNNYLTAFMQNYLSDRTQCEVERLPERFSGNFKWISTGIKFVSLMFNYFVSDLLLCDNSSILLLKYADDVTLCVPIMKAGGTTSSSISAEFDYILRWLSINKMSFHKEKCSQMLVTDNLDFDSSMNWPTFLLKNLHGIYM